MTSQRGGFALGLIVGLLLGLALALGVALYVTKVPVPFINKVPQRTAEQDAAEAERNKHWDPNAPLASKPAVKAAPPATTQAPQAQAPAPVASVPTRAPPPAAVAPKPPATGPAASTAVAKSTKPGADAFTYFVQVGAYARPEDAEQQRARVGLAAGAGCRAAPLVEPVSIRTHDECRSDLRGSATRDSFAGRKCVSSRACRAHVGPALPSKD